MEQAPQVEPELTELEKKRCCVCEELLALLKAGASLPSDAVKLLTLNAKGCQLGLDKFISDARFKRTEKRPVALVSDENFLNIALFYNGVL